MFLELQMRIISEGCDTGVMMLKIQICITRIHLKKDSNCNNF